MLLIAISARAQTSFIIKVSAQPVVAGESFRVQYILKGTDENAVIKTPDFKNFRLVEGPYLSPGQDRAGPIQNFTFTLVAQSPGTYALPAAEIVADGRLFRSNGATIEVISKLEAMQLLDKKGNPLNSAYFLRPGEDPYKKIRENLFLKIQVDKRTTYVGEPVLAVYKLYSRLQSKTDIIKNPGFYGFTVYDMINLADKDVTTETVNGRPFDVHTIRKVQLYPLQAGRFIIDPIEVKNKVEFSRSAVYKKTEQEIAEGMLSGQDDEPLAEGVDLYETSASTTPVEIEVKPLPEKEKPAEFTGAVGNFSVHSLVRNNQLARNEQGFYEITVDGAGNFTQLTAPVVLWPAGMEGFEPEVTDELDKTKSPLAGRRTFRFPFICTSPGTYTIPAVSFSYFDRDSNAYRSLSTSPVNVTVNNAVKKSSVNVTPENYSVAEQNEKAARKAGLIAVTAVLLILIYWLFIRKDKKKEQVPVEEKPALPAPEELLRPASGHPADDDKGFYHALQSAVWLFATQRFGLSGSEMNKQLLSAKISEFTGDPSLTEQLQHILSVCEAGMFTNASLEESREQLLQQVKGIFEKTDEALL